MNIKNIVCLRASRKLAVVCAAILGAASAHAAITGTAFLDYNGNAVMDTTTMVAGTVPVSAAIDVGVEGITVRATGVIGLGVDGIVNTADDVLGDCGAGPVTTAANGTYTIATTACNPAARIRIEFSGWAAPYNAGLGGSTTVQFVSDGASAVNLALVNPTQFCENNPALCTSAYTGGDQLAGPGHGYNALQSFPFSAQQYAPVGTGVATAANVGTTYGLAFHQASQRLFAAAYFKNGTGFGPNGPGAIYKVDPKTKVSTLFVDINAASMVDPARPGAFGAGAAGTDPFGAHAQADYTAAATAAGHTAWGDIDLSETQQSLYALNMANRLVYVFNPTAATPVTSSAGVGVLPAMPWPSTNAACSLPNNVSNAVANADLTGPGAFGMGVYKSALYVGARCYGSTSNSMYVFRYDLSQGLTGTWSIAATFDSGTLGYYHVRNIDISDIVFDRGDLVFNTRITSGDNLGVYASIARAYLACAADVASATFVLESNGSCTSAINGARTGNGVGTGAPGGGNYFFPQIGEYGTDYGLASQVGGLAQIPGNPVVVTTSYDQFAVYQAGGSWFDTRTGANLKDYSLITSATPLSFYQKQNTLGELEALCGAAPVEIGNRVWNDLNGNGVQDPNEPPLVGVTVELRNAENALLATAVTDSNGQYIFSNDLRGYPTTGSTTATNGGYVENGQGGTTSTLAARYGVLFATGDVLSVVISNASGASIQAPLTGLTLTTRAAGGNTALDSNFSAVGTGATATVTIGAPGANDHTIDAGFNPPQPASIVVAKSYVGDASKITTQPSITVNVTCSIGGAKSVTFTPPATGSITGLIAGETCNSFGETFSGQALSGGYTLAGPTSFTPASSMTLVSGSNALGVTNTIVAPAAASITVTKSYIGDTSKLTTQPSITVNLSCSISGAKSITFTPPATGAMTGLVAGETCNSFGEFFAGQALSGGYTLTGPTSFTPASSMTLVSGSNALGVTNTIVAPSQFDLSIIKTITSTGTYFAGVSSVTYSLVAKNNGPATAQGAIVIKDKLPAGLTGVSATGTNWTCTPTIGAAIEIVCTRVSTAGTLAAGVSADPIAVTANIDAGATGSLVNKAQVNPAAGEPLTETNPLGATNNGYEDGSPTTGSNNDDSKEITVVAPTYSLGNRVWVDSNNNGIMDGAELGVVGVTVRLLDASGNPVAGVSPLTTDSNGYYRFDNLPAGNYIVEIAPPAINGVTYVSSTGTNGSLTGPYEAGLVSAATGTNNKDHGTQTTPTTIRSGVVTLGPVNVVTGEVDSTATGVGANGPIADTYDVLTVDFGVFLPAKLGNLVWFDSNKNGKADAGEAGINGVTVILRDAAGNEIARQITRDRPAGETAGQAGPGWYQFTNLVPGQYKVEFAAPGYVSTVTGMPAATTGSPAEANNSQLAPGASTGQTALITLGAGDNNPQLDAGFVDVPPIPTLNQWSQLLLALMLLALAAIGVQRRKLTN